MSKFAGFENPLALDYGQAFPESMGEVNDSLSISQVAVETDAPQDLPDAAGQVDQPNLTDAMGLLERCQVPLRELVFDNRVQVRCKIVDANVKKYCEDMRRGVEFEPIVVFVIDGNKIVVDGNYRCQAAKMFGAEYIWCVINHGKSLVDAIKVAAESNSLHGIQMTRADKRLAITRFFEMKECVNFADNYIASLVGVGKDTVANVRKKLILEGKIDGNQTKRVGKDGRVTETSNYKKKGKTVNLPVVESRSEIDPEMDVISESMGASILLQDNSSNFSDGIMGNEPGHIAHIANVALSYQETQFSAEQLEEIETKLASKRKQIKELEEECRKLELERNRAKEIFLKCNPTLQ